MCIYFPMLYSSGMLYLANISSNGNSSLGALNCWCNCNWCKPTRLHYNNKSPQFKKGIPLPPPRVDIRLKTNFKGIDLFQENSFRVVQKYCLWWGHLTSVYHATASDHYNHGTHYGASNVFSENQYKRAILKASQYFLSQ